MLDVGEDIVRQYVLHKGKPPGQLRFARDVALTSYAAYRNIANKAWRWMENMATTYNTFLRVPVSVPLN